VFKIGAGDLIMSKTAQEIYSQVVRNLPPTERLRLANLILNELVQQNISIIDERDTWTEEDQLDLVAFSLQNTASLY
jgi:hypothetical protein